MGSGGGGVPLSTLTSLAGSLRRAFFFQALGEHPLDFPAWQVEIITVGEQPAASIRGFGRSREALEERRSFIFSLIPGLSYPIFLLHLAPFLLFAGKIVTENQGLPAYFSAVLKFFIPFYIPLILLACAWKSGVLSVAQRPGLSSLPKVQFSYFLSTMIKAAVPFNRALELSARAAGLEPVGGPARPGDSVLEHLRRYDIFRPKNWRTSRWRNSRAAWTSI